MLNALFISLQIWLQQLHTTYRIEYIWLWIWINFSWLLISSFGILYSDRIIATFEFFARRTTRIYIYWFGSVMFYSFITKHYNLSSVFIFSLLCGYGFLLFVNRLIYLLLYSYFRKSKRLLHKVVILGYNELAKKVATYLEEKMNTEIVGFCEDEKNISELTNYPILSPKSKIIETSIVYGVSDIYSTITPEQEIGIYKIIEKADKVCIHFRLIPDFSFFIKRSIHIDFLQEIPVLTLRGEPLEDVSNRIRKRIFDIVVSAFVVILILSWLIPLLGLFIYLDSKGPVFFIQQRTGKNNKPFGCIKFRSMKVNEEANSVQASRNDSRITRLGRFLRKTNLDEFPQFINVLKGEMSMVGPRPHMLKHTDTYSKLIDQYMIRQFLKPGITGWAQINGFRGETKTLEEMKGRIEHDIWYLENWGLWLDIRIMFLTVLMTIKGDKNVF
jgi:putative colanic acid biosynthesis UDP-glucose lipid carrier transferase